MKIVVSDASVLIDLLLIDLSEEFFALPIEVHTTDFVAGEIKNEKTAKFNDHIGERHIIVHKLTAKELGQLFVLKESYKSLSLSDCSCLFLCSELSATLLTGDNKLRKTAQSQDFPVHGILWVFDQLVKNKMLEEGEGAQKLKNLMDINPRLPQEDCIKKFEKWNP